jgi:hypothetical protein
MIHHRISVVVSDGELEAVGCERREFLVAQMW